MFAQIQPPFTAQFVGQVLRVVVADEKTLVIPAILIRLNVQYVDLIKCLGMR